MFLIPYLYKKGIMEFFISKGATLPILKMGVVKDGRSDYKSMMESLEVSSIFFSMVNTETGITEIFSHPAFLVPLVLADGAPPEYYVCVEFTKDHTRRTGRYKGEFLFKNDEGDLILPIREELFINITQGI